LRSHNREFRGLNEPDSGSEIVLRGHLRPAAASHRAGSTSHVGPGPDLTTDVGRVTDFVQRLLNATVALVLVVLMAPVLICLALVVLVSDGRPVLYRGSRLGRHGIPFTIFKFRTLVRDASAVVGAHLVSPAQPLAIGCGEFLRDTRLDELPQLFNILKGDMTVFGPRPERREVYERLCRHIDGYDRRFAVRPGLVGLAQLLTPHNAPKRLRSLVDNCVLRRRWSPLRTTFFVSYAAWAVVRTTATRIVRLPVDAIFSGRLLSIGGSGSLRDRRTLRRVRARRSRIHIESRVEATIVDANEEALCFVSPERLASSSTHVRFDIEVRFRRWRLGFPATRVRIAHCRGEVLQRRRTAEGWAHVVHFQPTTESSRYIIHQYLLRKSFMDPFLS